MAGGGTAPAGWFADPYGGRVLRYWDGDRWTDWLYRIAGEPMPGDAIRAERQAARWVRAAWWFYPPLITATGVVAALRAHTTVHTWSHLFHPSSSSSHLGPSWTTIGLQLGSVPLFAINVLVILWAYRATAGARSIGLPMRRSPALGVVGWLVPVISFWWPYVSIRDCAPAPAELWPTLGWWWFCFLGQFVAGAATFAIAAAFSPDAAAPALALLSALACGYAWQGRVLASQVLAVHDRELEARHLSNVS